MAVGAGNILRVDARFLFNSNQRVINTFHLRNDGASIDEADAVDDMVEIIEALYVLLAAILQTIQILQDLRIIDVTDAADVGVGTFVDSSPGTAAGLVAPQNCWGLMLDTQRLASKGRKFFGPAGTAHHLQNGILSAGTLADVADVGDYMIIAQVATNNTWRFGLQSTLVGVGFLPFVGYGVSPTVITQRRRRVGVGV